MKMSVSVSKLSGLVLLSLVAAGCGSDDGAARNSAAGTPPAAAAEAGVAQEDAYEGARFTFLGHGGEPQQRIMDVINEFAGIVGAQALSDSPVEIARVGAEVKSGNITTDVVTINSVLAERYCGSLLEPWDMSLIDTSQLPEGVEPHECGIPETVFANALGYDGSAFTGDVPETWADFFDVRKFPGGRALSSKDPQMAMEIALLGDGVAPADLYPLDVDRALAKLGSIRSNLVFYGTGAEQEQILQSGRAAVCMCWAGRVYIVNENGGDWKMASAPPVGRINMYGLVKGSGNAEVAASAMNYLLGAEQQAHFQEATTYPSVNVEAEPQLNDNNAAVNVLDEERFEPLVVIDSEFWAENLDDLTDRWTTWVSS